MDSSGNGEGPCRTHLQLLCSEGRTILGATCISFTSSVVGGDSPRHDETVPFEPSTQPLRVVF